MFIASAPDLQKYNCLYLKTTDSFAYLILFIVATRYKIRDVIKGWLFRIRQTWGS